MFNVPNTITLLRVFAALATVYLLWQNSDNMLWTAFVLTALIIWADGLDGYFARKLNQTTRFGAAFDIVGDRIVEMTYLIAFACLQWIPAWVPLLFLVRGNLVDAIRAQAQEQGFTAFGQSTMMNSGLGKFLVASNFSRFTYAVVKAFAFCLLIASKTSQCSQTALPVVSLGLIYFSAVFCLIRGLPVLIEGQRLLKLE